MFKIVVPVIVILTLGIGGFFLYQNFQTKSTTQPIPTPQTTPSLSPESETDLLGGIDKAFSFKDSRGNLKKIVLYSTGDPQKGYELYLTDDVFTQSTAIKIANIGQSDIGESPHFSPDTKKVIFVVDLIGPGDTQDFIVADEEGKIITSSLMGDNYSSIGFGTVIKPQYGVSFNSFIADTKGTFILSIVNALGEEYQVKIDGFTGKYIEGTRKRIK